jgi:ribosomal protein S16
MIVKYKHISKKKSINKLLLRFKPEGSYLYKVYKLVVIKKKTRAKNGKYLEKIGIYNPIFNDRYLYFDTTKLYF